MRFASILLLCAFCLSCARELPEEERKERADLGGKTSVHFDFSNDSQVSTFLTSTLLIFARKLEGLNDPSLALDDTLVINAGTLGSLVLDNGNYTFSAIVYDGASIDLTTAGTARCGDAVDGSDGFSFGSFFYTLNGTDRNVNLSLSNGDCSFFNFGLALKPISVYSCATDGNVNNLVDGSSCDGTGGTPTAGSIQFFRAEIIPFLRVGFNAPTVFPGTGIRSACIAAGASGTAAANNLYIPTNAPILVQIKTYTNSLCTAASEDKTYTFTGGLSGNTTQNSPPNKTKFISGSTNERLFLIDQ